MSPTKFNALYRELNNKHSFNQLYKEYYPRIMAHLKHRFGNLISAEDVAQDLFFKLLKSNRRDYVEHPYSWIMKVADNIAIDQIRSSHIESPLTDSFLEPFDVQLVDDGEVIKYFEFLDETTQRILYMYFWEGYSLKEIAAVLNIKYGNVRAKVSRAYKKFKEKM